MSKIEVDAITQQSGTTLTVGGGACKTATVDATTVTLGRSGGTVSLAAGATQSGFGRTGTVDWEITPQTGSFQATNGKGYFMNTTSGALTLTTPASPSAGDIFAVADYARTFNTNNLTISPHASAKIGGFAENAVLDVSGQAATFVYVDSTQGWVNVQNAEDTETGTPPFMEATGGTITEDGNFKIHTFTGPGTFQVTKLATQSPAPIYNIVSYTVAAGGGGSGGSINNIHTAAGGGGGGFREGKNAPVDSYTASPLNAPAGIPVSVTSYPITIGAGGAGGCGPTGGTNGVNSVFGPITSAGGGGGAAVATPGTASCRTGKPGGSGGGGSSQTAGAGGSGNNPPVSPPQGNNGGAGTDAPPDIRGGAGGGATATGPTGSPVANQGAGGTGATTNISGSPVGYSGGGASGGTSQGGPGNGGAASPCGSGAAGTPANVPSSPVNNYNGSNGTANRAGGGGGSAASSGAPGSPGNFSGGAGGSGIVMIRYKFK